MERSQPTRLFTTRLRAGAAVALTAFVFTLAVRDLLHSVRARQWLWPLDLVLHGWPLVAANIVFYGYLCWLAFCFIRGTSGEERVVMLGWFAGVLVSPLEILRHGWALEIRYVGAVGLGVALLAAASLLLRLTIVGRPTVQDS